MEVRLEDKKCENCAHCNKLLGTLNYKCANRHSEFYKQKVNKKDYCDKFKEYTYCLKCVHFNKDAKICRNKKSIYFNRYGAILPRFGCEHKYDAGYVASTISDILHLDKKKSYSLLLYKLKRELLKIDNNYQKYIDWYNCVSYNFGHSLYYAFNSKEEAIYFKEKYLDNVLKDIVNGNYLKAFNIFKNMLIEIDNKYFVVKHIEKYSKLLHC